MSTKWGTWLLILWGSIVYSCTAVQSIREAIGGSANLQSLASCATHPRLELHDHKIDHDRVSRVAEVNASFITRGQ